MQQWLKLVITYGIILILFNIFAFQADNFETNNIIDFTIDDAQYLDNEIITSVTNGDLLYLLYQTANPEEYILTTYKLPDINEKDSVVIYRTSPYLKLISFQNYVLLIQYQNGFTSTSFKYTYFDTKLSEHEILYNYRISAIQIFNYEDKLFLSVLELDSGGTSYNSLLQIEKKSDKVIITPIHQFAAKDWLPIAIVQNSPTILHFYFKSNYLYNELATIEYNISSSTAIYTAYLTIGIPEYSYLSVEGYKIQALFYSNQFIYNFINAFDVTVASLTIDNPLFSPTSYPANILYAKIQDILLLFPSTVRTVISAVSYLNSPVDPNILPLNAPLYLPIISFNLTSRMFSFHQYSGTTRYYNGDFVTIASSSYGQYILSNPNSAYGKAGQILPIQYNYAKLLPAPILALNNPITPLFSILLFSILTIYHYRKRPLSTPQIPEELYPQA